jgi:hypothetical protein
MANSLTNTCGLLQSCRRNTTPSTVPTSDSHINRNIAPRSCPAVERYNRPAVERYNRSVPFSSWSEVGPESSALPRRLPSLDPNPDKAMAKSKPGHMVKITLKSRQSKKQPRRERPTRASASEASPADSPRDSNRPTPRSVRSSDDYRSDFPDQEPPPNRAEARARRETARADFEVLPDQPACTLRSRPQAAHETV